MREFVLFIFIFLFIALSSKAQFSTMFNDTIKPFGNGGYDFSCIAKDDSFYYGLGGVNNYQPLWDNMLIKFDENFNIVSKRKYTDTIWYNANYPYNTISVNKKQLIFCTQMSKNQMSIIYGKIVALNKQTLDTLWTKVIEHPDTAYVNLPNAVVFSDLTAIKQTPDNGYILTGNYNLHCSGADKRSFLLKTDSMGNVEWRRTYNQYYTFFDVELAADSGYYVPCTINNSSMVLVKFDKNGLYQWKTFVNSNINPSYPMDVTIRGNYAIVASVFWYDISNSLRAVNVVKVNITNHSILWEKNYYLYNSVECLGLHQAMGVETLSDGSIIVNGTVEKYGTDKSAFILKLNTNGDSLWTKTYRYTNSNISRSQLNDLMICDDGGFLGVGFYSPQAGAVSSAWMFKTDANGTIGWESPMANGESNKAKLWPNPATEFVNIEFANKPNQNAELMVYNSLGQLVLQKAISKNEQQIKIDLQSFEVGVYLYELRAADGVLGVGKFVVE